MYKQLAQYYCTFEKLQAIVEKKWPVLNKIKPGAQ